MDYMNHIKQSPLSMTGMGGIVTGFNFKSVGGYEIERSLRFNKSGGDNHYLNRTPSSAGNRRTFTFSCWVKRGEVDASEYRSMFAAGTSSAPLDYFLWWNNDQLAFSNYNQTSYNVRTTRIFRDPSAWYHLVLAVDTTQGTAANRVKIYVNGSQETDLDASSYPSQNYDTEINNTTPNFVGFNEFNYMDGYMAEVNFVDGQQLTPSSFGKTNALTGQWIPKSPSVTYGTNGFFLKFADNSNTTAATLGKDSSGNGNNYTPNNFSVSAGGGNDSLTDTPTNNFCTLTPLYGYGTTYVSPTNGNLDASLGSTNYQTFTTIAMPPSGKWYAECKFTDVETGRTGIKLATDTTKWGGISYVHNGAIRVDDSEVQTSLSSISDNDIVGMAVDRDANTIQFYKNGSTVGSAVAISATGDYYFTQRRNSSGGGNVVAEWNFGQRDFGNLPSGFKSLCTSNLSDPTISIPKEHFDSLLYVGDTSGNLTVTGLEFEPDFVWIKCRETTDNHQAFDTVRGFTNGRRLFPNENSSEATNGSQYGMISTQNGGFTVGAGPFEANRDGDNHVAWNWKGGGSASSNSDGTITSSISANTTAGFSIVTWTGTGSAGTIGHGLGVAPKWFVVKLRSGSQDWFANNGMIMNDYGKYFKWNTDGSSASDTNVFPNTAPTSSVFSVGTDGAVNASGSTYVAYCFSEVAGYSKISSYEGLGGTNGPFVNVGFRPSFVMIKNVDSGSRWWVNKTSKIPGRNLLSNGLAVNVADAEQSLSSIDILSNGFKVRNNGSYTNENNSTHMYMAFAENPFKYANAR